MGKIESIILHAFEYRKEITPNNINTQVYDAVIKTIEQLDQGIIRIADKKNGKWIVNEWIKKAVILFFCLKNNDLIQGSYSNFYDKIQVKYKDHNLEDFQKNGVRIVPPAIARKGSYIAKNCILMPSYVNIGAYIDCGTMIDTWATIGSCAQIGKNVHISGGVGIGGVLEPLQATPTIIEDHCFIGARSEIVEGVIIEERSVISMGVYIGQSTRIYDRENGEVFYGRVPAGSVVVSGNLPSKDGKYSLYCAVIVKRVDDRTLNKVQINELLRNI